MDKEPWALRLSEGITHKKPVRLNPDKTMTLVLNKLTGKNLLSMGGIIQIYQFLGSDIIYFLGVYLVGEAQRSY